VSDPDAELIFPAGAAAWRAWLEEHHESADEVLVGFWKKASGRATMIWSEAVDEALCFGWIDGVRRSLDEHRYVNRFTPRRPGSNWSRVNVDKVERLTAEGRMTPAGLRAFEQRRESRSGVYSYENAPRDLEPHDAERVRAHPEAWAFWQAQPPSYRRQATWWVVSAKKPETRERRLAVLIEDSAAGRRLRQLTSPARRG
jgi:uncharacterized protein YdeI (YjbR/CyaY-like superfamily)